MVCIVNSEGSFCKMITKSSCSKTTCCGKYDIQKKADKGAFLQKMHILQREGREGGESSTQANEQEKFYNFFHFAHINGHGRANAYKQGAGNIHRDGSPWQMA